MVTSPQPLLLRVPRLLDESLPSLLMRFAHRNAYDPPSILDRLCLDGLQLPPSTRPGFLPSPALFARLTTLTQLTLSELYTASGHRFAAVLLPPNTGRNTLALSETDQRPLLDTAVALTHLRPESAAQFCPACLKEAAYHRVSWLPVTAALCLAHRQLLVHQCPRCRQSVAIRAIVTACCRRCGADLTQACADPLRIDAEMFQAQRVIQAWLAGRPLAPEDAVLQLPSESGALLYQILDGIASSVMAAQPFGVLEQHPIAPILPIRLWARIGKYRLSPAQIVQIYTLAFQGLVDWPKGFFALLDAAPRLDLEVWGLTRWAGFTTCYRARVAGDQHRAAPYPFVAQAWEQYHLDQQPYVSIAMAAALLESSTALIERLLQVRLLADQDGAMTDSAEQHLVALPKLIALHRRWHHSIDLETVATWVGIAPDSVVELVRAGVVATTSDPASTPPAQWRFTPAAIDAYLSWLALHLWPVRDGAEVVGRVRVAALIDFPQTTYLLSSIGLTIGKILLLISSGHLWGYRRAGQLLDIQRLLFDPKEVQLHIRVVQEKEALMSSSELCRRIGVQSSTLSRWVQAGWLTPIISYLMGASYFERHAVEAFRASCLRQQDIPSVFGISAQTVKHWIRSGDLQPMTAPELAHYRPLLFRRQDVAALCQQFQKPHTQQ